jgi:hypothetical protein
MDSSPRTQLGLTPLIHPLSPASLCLSLPSNRPPPSPPFPSPLPDSPKMPSKEAYAHNPTLLQHYMTLDQGGKTMAECKFSRSLLLLTRLDVANLMRSCPLNYRHLD